LYQNEGANSIFNQLGFKDKASAETCYNKSFYKFIGDDDQLLHMEEPTKKADLLYIRACLESFLIYPMAIGESKNSCTKEDAMAIMAKAMKIMSTDEATKE